MNFARRLRQLRRASGLTLYRLAQLSGLSKETIRLLEQPGSDPRLSTLGKLAKALGVSIQELVRAEGKPAKPKRTPKRK